MLRAMVYLRLREKAVFALQTGALHLAGVAPGNWRAHLAFVSAATCRIPDDCIDKKRYPLFMARTVLQELIESLQSNWGELPC